MNTEEYPVTGKPSLEGGNFPRCQIGQLSHCFDLFERNAIA